MARIECIFLDSMERICFIRTDATKFIVDESTYQLDAVFPVETSKHIANGMMIGFHDVDDNLVFYEIITSTTDTFERSVAVYAELAAMPELRDEAIVDKRPTRTSAGMAAMAALEGTRWQVRIIEDCGVGSCRFWYTSSWAALQKIAEVWGCIIAFSWEIDDAGVVARYVDIKRPSSEWRGKRFELHKGMTALKVTYDDSSVCTALYGRGKGEEIDTGDGDVAYGRKISFADVEWKVANGDPVDKPLGQEWVEDPEATAALGRNGRKRTRIITFDDCTDKKELLRLTWDALQEAKIPKLTIRASVTDYESVWGYKFEAIRMNDIVAVILDEIGLEVLIAATKIKRDYINPDRTPITLGNEIKTIADIQVASNAALKKAKQNALYGAQVAQKNPALLKGYLDTMATRILSSGTNFYTDKQDGSLVFENSDNSAAVKITGEGVLLADQKVGGEWNWCTAITGSGMVADMITSGTIQATLIRILGSDMFYWDAANIHIFDPANELNEIRIGMYDGKNYGIGFSQDGGMTWKSAIDFNGAHISTSERYSSATATNTSLIFAAASDGATTEVATMYAYIIGYTGAQRVTPAVSGISGMPTGMTAESMSPLSDLSVPIKITVAKGVNLGSRGNAAGQLTVRVTAPVETNIILNWAKINAGAAGSNGADGKDGANGSDGKDGKDGSNGTNGISSATITIYQRAKSIPAVPSEELTFSFSDGQVTGYLQGWSRSIPDGSDPCYSTTAFVSSDGQTAKITAADWSVPTMAVKNGVNGTDGKNGADGKDGTSVTILGSYDTVEALHQAHPTGASGESYIVNGDLYVWVSTGWQNVGTIQGPAGQDGKDGVDGKDGKDGTNGTNGTSRYIHIRYSANQSGANMVVSPTSTTKYIGIAVTATNTAPTSASSYTWSKYAGDDGKDGKDGTNGTNGTNGRDGEDGQDGLSRADVTLYQRSATKPGKPSANVTYTFLTGGLSGDFAPWQQNIPASNGEPCWMIKYAAIASTTTLSIAPGAWSDPVEIVKDGENGKDGADGKDGEGTKTFLQADPPDPLAVDIRDGDLWFNTDNNNRMYRWNAATAAWVPVADTSIDQINSTLMQTVSDLEIAKGNITALVGASYVTNDQLQNTITTLQNQITATANDLTTTFSKVVSDATGRVTSDFSTLIRASGDGVEVGRSDSKFKTLLSNDRLSFIQVQDGSSVEVAYISDHKLYITDAQITNELAIGVGVHKLFKWRRKAYGLALIYQS